MSLKGARLLLLVSAVLLGALSLAACGGGGSSSSSTAATEEAAKSESETEPASDSKPSAKAGGFPDYSKVAPKGLKPATGMKGALVIAADEVGAQKSIINGFEAGAKELGIGQEDFSGNGLEDIASQVAGVASAIARHPDFILLFPGTPSGLNAQVKEARTEGIKVITDLLPSEQE